jgi:hypothetical protein
MSVAADSVLEQALALTTQERARVASELLASLDNEDAPEADIEHFWDDRNATRRAAMFESREARTFTREDVLEGLTELST